MIKLMKTTMFATVFCALAAIYGHAAFATVWTIDTVQNGTDSGFGFSSFHDASGSNVMTGSNLGNISGAGALGTYNDVTGAFSATFNVTGSGGPSFTLNGILDFGGTFNNTLASNSTLTADFAGTLVGLGDTIIGFKAGYVCCGSTNNDPNSFNAAPGGAVMTLWGADDFNIVTGAYGTSAKVGMDIRIHLTAVEDDDIPEPMSMALFGMGLAGLGLMRRRIAKR